MKGLKKTILIDNQLKTVVERYRGSETVWVAVPDDVVHILRKEFWDGKEPSYRANHTLYEWPTTVAKDQTLIQRIEYALHSRYDADNRLLLEEALAALKERV